MIRRRLAALVVAAVASAAPAALAAAPASAVLPMGCGALDPADTAAVVTRAAAADDVFVATVERAQASPSAAAAVLHRVIVTTPLAGTLVRGKPVDVLLTPPSAAPTEAAPTLAVAGSYLFWADAGQDSLTADGCEGWTSAAGLDDVRLAALQQAIAAAAEERREVTLVAPPDGVGPAPELGRLLAPGGAIALVGVLGLVLVARVRRP